MVYVRAPHQIIQHQKSPSCRRFGAGHTYLVRDGAVLRLFVGKW